VDLHALTGVTTTKKERRRASAAKGGGRSAMQSHEDANEVGCV
jgi:hypothetical protein